MKAMLIMPQKLMAVYSKRAKTERHSFSQPSSRATTDSSASTAAGGVFGTGTLNVSNMVIAQNLAPALAADNDIDVTQIHGSAANFIGTVGGDPHLGSLQDNGGPTLSMRADSDSFLIDAGINRRATIDRQVGSSPFQGDQLSRQRSAWRSGT